ncbi:metallophosphoesterase family protein [Paracraurococcus ruber]|uniref:Serine/threonine protein phosphatase n=1 Tax=Paracraurococcus ruber TaxID=77675 RepID=A0ABS1D2M3_9PROT|nr:metallophosphoesterase family protein [Paracraurococcus ruber]MBK1661095.1 serine/threonine protein phosphatase [Paracraurococcus ruber]TDG25719.1 serine/threonine protein phosphatase [Paracraurococcus ruber]
MVNEALAPGALPAGLRIYAIGDVHGCADRLARLHALVAADARARPAEEIVLVHLGDYVDRGEDSAGVVERLLGPAPIPGAEVVNLLGNHEVMMLDACDPRGPEGALTFWLENGGEETLASYRTAAEDPDFRDAIPPRHLAFLQGCELRFSAGDYLFVHAGIRPGLPLERQDPFDLIWIREPFLSFEGDLPQVVVHGHTPAAAPAIRSHRIGIDTGACFGGDLTCLVLEGQRLRFLTS